MSNLKPASTWPPIRTPIMDRGGNMSWEWIKWFQDATQRLQNGLSSTGDLIGAIDTDHITDGTGNPLAGGKAAYKALVTSPPVAQPHQWINGFNISTGDFTQTRPDYSDLTGTPRFADEEVPAGTIDGVNTTFTLANSPNPVNGLILVLAGLVQYRDASGDYTLSGSTITFAAAPSLGPILAWYRY